MNGVINANAIVILANRTNTPMNPNSSLKKCLMCLIIVDIQTVWVLVEHSYQLFDPHDGHQ